MKSFRIPAAILGLAISSGNVHAGPVPAKGSKEVTAAQVNGTWSYRGNTLKVQALGNNQLRVAFDGTFEYKTPQGLMANTGEGGGIATIEGDTAIFRPEGAEEGCKITMKFTGGKLIVTQEGICGFGNRVTADGTYKKTSKKPKFGE